MSTTEGPDRGYEEREWCAFFHWVFFKRFFFFFPYSAKNLFISPLNAIRYTRYRVDP